LGKVVINIPSGLRQAIEKTDPEKPYDICLDCAFLQNSCDGPNILAMEYPRWVEWANSRAKQLRLTRAQIAEKANLPKSTLDSILSGRTQDIRASTMRAITRVLVGGCWGQYPCHLAALLMESEELRVDEQIAALQKELTEARQKNDELKEQLKDSKEDDSKKVDYLKSRVSLLDEQIRGKDAQLESKEANIRRKEKTIAVLCVIIALLGVLIIGTLIYDKTHPDVGWFQPEVTAYE